MEVRGVEVFHWNPRRPLVRGRIGRYLPKVGRVNNFGDMLGPAVVERLAPSTTAGVHRRLLTIGSVMHFAKDGDVVWGSGVNGKVPLADVRAERLDIRAVRGPLTRAILIQRGEAVPEVYGDPGLLAPSLLGIARAAVPEIELMYLPNLHDARSWPRQRGFVDPRRPYRVVIDQIARARHLVTSSLHGAVIADALGVPVSLVRPGSETAFKYEDYYEGTGRRLPNMSPQPRGAEDSPAQGLDWDPGELLAAFPGDLWSDSLSTPNDDMA